MDVFRACGIILMVMGHIGFGDDFDKFIHAFHMPMFFFISGFFYKKLDVSIKTVVIKKARTLLIPYLFFGVFHYLISLKLTGISIAPLLHLFTINTVGLPIAGALWFLTALYATDVIYAILEKYDKKILIIPLVLVGSFADQVLPYPLPWAFSAALVGLGLYWFGDYTRRNENKLKRILNMKIWELLIFGIVIGVLIFINGNINMREGKYSFLPLFWINALSACYIGISLSKYVERFHTIFLKCLESIGKNSIIYVCLNQLIILILRKFIPNENKMFMYQVLILILTMVILYVLSIAFTKTKLRVFIGKN